MTDHPILRMTPAVEIAPATAVRTAVPGHVRRFAPAGQRCLRTDGCVFAPEHAGTCLPVPDQESRS
jgi:hypothetical protein